MKVTALDVNGNKAFDMTYQECWPKTVSAIELNHSTLNTPVRLTVEMQYAYWESSDIKMDGVTHTAVQRMPSPSPSTSSTSPPISGHGGNQGHDAGGTEGPG